MLINGISPNFSFNFPSITLILLCVAGDIVQGTGSHRTDFQAPTPCLYVRWIYHERHSDNEKHRCSKM